MKHRAPLNQVCMEVGCSNKAQHPAPIKDSDNYFWFCIEHAKVYNHNWDYYSNKTDEELENDLKSRINGGYQLLNTSSINTSSTYKVKFNDQLKEEFLKTKTFRKNLNNKKKAPKTNNACHSFVPTSIEEKQAITTLKLKPPITQESINKSYKRIAKSCHPDITTGQNSKRRESLQAILQQASNAYTVLKNSIRNN